MTQPAAVRGPLDFPCDVLRERFADPTLTDVQRSGLVVAIDAIGREEERMFRASWVYFATRKPRVRIGEGLVKIGYSRNPQERMDQLKTQLGFRPILIGVVEGGYEREQQIHKVFSHLRRVGEWFVLDDELFSFIKSNRMTKVDAAERGYA